MGCGGAAEHGIVARAHHLVPDSRERLQNQLVLCALELIRLLDHPFWVFVEYAFLCGDVINEHEAPRVLNLAELVDVVKLY